ncbi:retrovirus-related pol polyprotein from transposon TNT 1-94 [Tanacetum coccineum]|uniref:Retrovirus-related pol polyprotein from transposon TNT 1-94 n=1 Tax=Tanacetum coccineum TaxID=301880 RepID=A0ABQ5E2I3_9ASTR
MLSTKQTSWFSRNLEQLPSSKLHDMGNICLGVNLEPDEWIKDSGCSKYMTGNQKLFSSYKAYNEGNVIFGSNLCDNIIGKGQICDNKCRVTFSEHDSEITKDGKVIGRGIRKKDLYVMKLGNKPKDKICLATIDENSTLWHKKQGRANMRLIQSLASKELVRNLPKLKFDQHFCDAFKIEKQAHISHKAKNIVSTTRFLELLHMDLFGPSTIRSYRGNLYALVIVDEYSRMDHGREFDNEVQFEEFCNANAIEPKNVNEALTDENWIIAMQEELNQFIANDVWELVPQPKNMTIIGTKWVFRNKLDENSVVSCNKARLVAQDFKLFQMDIKSAFQNGLIKEERKTRKDYGTKRGHHSTSSSSAFGQTSSSHLKNDDDDDDGNDEGASRTITPSPTCFVDSLSNDIPRLTNEKRGGLRSIGKGIKNLLKGKKKNDEDDITTPSHITKSSSPYPPNAPSKTPSTKDTSSTFATNSSLFESKPQSLPPTSNDSPSPQSSNPFLDNIMDAPPRPSNPISLQSHHSLDITLSLSPITPLDHILDTPSLPSPQPPPQPPLIGHPIYFNTFDYQWVNCLCCFHNRNLIFSFRYEMNLMFTHIEYLLTSAIALPSPPHP